MLRPDVRSATLSRFRDLPFVTLALVGALTAAFALAGCGRKGPLDPPPAASVAGEQGKADAGERARAAQDAQQKKHFVLDPLLN